MPIATIHVLARDNSVTASDTAGSRSNRSVEMTKASQAGQYSTMPTQKARGGILSTSSRYRQEAMTSQRPTRQSPAVPVAKAHSLGVSYDLRWDALPDTKTTVPRRTNKQSPPSSMGMTAVRQPRFRDVYTPIHTACCCPPSQPICMKTSGRSSGPAVQAHS